MSAVSFDNWNELKRVTDEMKFFFEKSVKDYKDFFDGAF